MDSRIGEASHPVGPARADRHPRASDTRDEPPLPPSTIIELGRTPERPGLYNARGLRDGAPFPARTEAPAGAEAPGRHPEPHPHASEDLPSLGGPQARLVPSNAQVGALVAGSPETAAALRNRLPPESTTPQRLPANLMAGIQPLAQNALTQAEKSSAAAEHEDEGDPTRKDPDAPAPAEPPVRAVR